jgi:transcriptional regulator with XRE-family HTH domain
MQDAAIRKALANRIDASHAQFNKYESGQNTPPIDRLILLARELVIQVLDALIAKHNMTTTLKAMEG